MTDRDVILYDRNPDRARALAAALAERGWVPHVATSVVDADAWLLLGARATPVVAAVPPVEPFGTSTVRELRRVGAHAPLVGLVNGTNEQSRQALVAAGLTAVVDRSADPAELAAAIEAALAPAPARAAGSA